jgi:hypothetical protein
MRQRVAAAAQIRQMPKELMLTDINTDFPGIYGIYPDRPLGVLQAPRTGAVKAGQTEVTENLYIPSAGNCGQPRGPGKIAKY